MKSLKFALVLTVLPAMLACSPEIGSKDWCDSLKKKEKVQWTAQEAADFTKHCILPK
jgi:hypothetical protein